MNEHVFVPRRAHHALREVTLRLTVAMTNTRSWARSMSWSLLQIGVLSSPPADTLSGLDT
jgi:hypothetical protein